MSVSLLLFLGVFLAFLTAFCASFGAALSNRRSEQSSRFFHKPKKGEFFGRAHNNPVLPQGKEPWEAEAVINPAAIHDGERTHLLYRAIGSDGVSRMGYASSAEGAVFDDRVPYPVFSHQDVIPRTGLKYDPGRYGSGGSWSGVEDPRAVVIDNRVYITYNAFNGWDSMRVALTSISLSDLQKKLWNFTPPRYLSPAGERHKNWVLFPEKIKGMFALFHNLYAGDTSRVRVEYIPDLETHDPQMNRFESPDPNATPDNTIGWHYRMRSIGPPPLKTPYGWLSFYHAMDPAEPSHYKMGAILHDTMDPSLVVARSKVPVLAPEAPYEAHYGAKPGIVYACGATAKGDELTLYYGGADSVVCAARTSLSTFVERLVAGAPPAFIPLIA
jgi:predicted GH43/DUF377 family glycosyl hydrolase